MITGEKIRLRYIRADEVESVLSLINNLEYKGEFARTLLKSPADFKREFEQTGLSSDKHELFVITNTFDEVIGVIGHFQTFPYSSAREFGFSVLKPDCLNKGVATEAVQLLTRYLFESHPVNRLQICMPTGHLACEKIAVKCGYNKEGVLRGVIYIRGRYHDVSIYSLLREEFFA